MHEPDGVDRHAGFLNVAAGLVEGLLAESVDAGGDQQDRLAALDVLHPVDGVGQRVVKIGLREPGNGRRLQGLLDLAPVWW